MNPNAFRFAALMGSASLLTMTTMLGAHAQNRQVAQAQMAQAGEVPEQVLITGSLIHGTVAIGVPVTTLNDEDFREVGALTTADLLKELPSVTILSSINVINTGGNVVGGQATSIHNIGGDTTGPKTLLMVDGKRVPFQSTALCIVDPSIIPQLAIDRIDVLADGASATYGSDAVAGVLNLVLKRGYDGAISQFRIGESTGLGGLSEMGSQLYGKKWDTGDITVTYEFYHNAKVQGPGRDYLTYDWSLFGLDNRTPLVSASPGIASVGKPTQPASAPVGFDPSYGTSCNNCYSIPKGQNGIGLTWANVLAHPGVQNEYNPYNDAWFIPDSTRNAAVLTFDQDIVKDLGLIQNVRFTADAYYNNRRQIIHSAGTTGPAKTNALELTIPTSNPFYPVGAPSGLQVAYNFSKEIPGYLTSGEGEGRWEGGFNFDLPSSWKGTISYTKTQEHAYDSFDNIVNPNLVSAAVGNTVKSDGLDAAYSKPANIPYLNVFCDPLAFTCNNAATLAYISAHRTIDERQVFNETNGTFDGPLFDLPGGTVRAAVGGDFLTEHYLLLSANGATSLAGDAAPQIANDSGGFDVWAAFAQLNVPLVGEANSIPFVKGFEIELSGRIDHYSNVGQTKNPKAALNWDVGEGLVLKATWGTSFRAPTFNEISKVVGPVDPINVVAGATGNTEPTCTAVGAKPTPGSAAAALDPNCTAASQFLGGISLQGGAGAANGIFGPGHTLHPETAVNWATGFDFAPTEFLKGLDINFNFYNIKINDVIQSLTRGNGLSDPISTSQGFWILNTDPNFANYVAAIVKLPGVNPLINASNVSFIEYRLKTNIGWIKYGGFDFAGSYNWDMGDFGAWNAGVVGNYVLGRQRYIAPTVVDDFQGKDSGGRLNYRARLGWAGGPGDAWSLTGFMNYQAHYGNQESGDNIRAEVLPPSCFQLGNPACNASGLPQFAQYTQQYALLTNYEPARVTFDLSLGYKTGERPANEYLRNLGFQLVIDNILDKRPNFSYQIAFAGGSPRAFDDHQDPAQRTVSFIVTKVW
jgi:iron complex outermembrane receptor protein